MGGPPPCLPGSSEAQLLKGKNCPTCSDLFCSFAAAVGHRRARSDQPPMTEGDEGKRRAHGVRAMMLNVLPGTRGSNIIVSCASGRPRSVFKARRKKKFSLPTWLHPGSKALPRPGVFKARDAREGPFAPHRAVLQSQSQLYHAGRNQDMYVDMSYFVLFSRFFLFSSCTHTPVSITHGRVPEYLPLGLN